MTDQRNTVIEQQILDVVGDKTVQWDTIRSNVDVSEDELERTVYELLDSDKLDADRHLEKQWEFYKPEDEVESCDNCGIKVEDGHVEKTPVAGQHWGLRNCGECGEGLGTYIIGES